MGALAPLNLLVILNTHVPEALGEVRREEELKQKIQEAAESSEARPNLCENGVDESMLHRSGGDGLACGSEAFRNSNGLAVPAARATAAGAPASHGGGNSATGGAAFSFGGGSASAAIIGAIGLAAFGTGNFGPGVYGNTGSDESSAHGVDANFSFANNAAQNGSSENSSSEISGKSSSSTGPPPTHQLCRACQWICPDMVLVPRSVLERSGTSEVLPYPPSTYLEERSIRLVMSYDNIAALMVIQHSM